MNPWTSIVEEDPPLHSSHVTDFLIRQHLQKATKSERATGRGKHFTVKDRNYETYNYVGATAKEIDDVEVGESDNTLSSILVRAMQRKARRREIDQAMKIKNLEETKRKLEEEKRRCKDERKKQEVKLREMKEAHRLRLMREEQYREKQIKFARQTKLADEFQKMTLMRHYFQGFKMIVEINRSNQRKAKYHYRQRIMQKTFSKLVINKEQEQLWKNRMASGFHNVTLLNKFFIIWREETSARRRQMTTAVQYHEQSLLRQCLWSWRWTSLDLLMQRRTDANKASYHYQRTLLLRGLRAWRGFLEAKKARRRRDLVGTHLRGLVKDIVPDFSPPTSEDDNDDDDDDVKREADGVTRPRDNDKDDDDDDDRWKDLISLMTI